MKKVLMIFEDFQDSGQTQTDLKKVGFDVLAVNTVARLGDTILTFRPDVVVGNGGQKLPSLQIGQELKKLKGFRGKVVLLLPHGLRPSPQELAAARVDVLVEAPVQPRRLIEILSKQMNMDPAALLEKFNKAKIQEHATPPAPRSQGEAAHESDMVRVKGQARDSQMQKVHGSRESTEMVNVKGTKPPGATEEFGESGTIDNFGPPEESRYSDKERMASYQEHLKGLVIDTHETSHNKAAVKARQEELKKGWDSSLLDQLDQLKRQFAAALFKKDE